MKKLIMASVMILLLSNAAYSEEQKPDLDISNDSSYPKSNQLSAPPNEPDHVFGRSTHNLPSGEPATSGTNSDPSMDKEDNDPAKD